MLITNKKNSLCHVHICYTDFKITSVEVVKHVSKVHFTIDYKSKTDPSIDDVKSLVSRYIEGYSFWGF